MSKLHPGIITAMHLAPGTYRLTVHPDGGIDIVPEVAETISKQDTHGHGLETIWSDEELQFDSFVEILRNQGRVSRHGMEWLGTGSQLRALHDFLTENEFIRRVSRPRFLEFAKNTFIIPKLKDRSSLNTISWKQYDLETVFLQKAFFGA